MHQVVALPNLTNILPGLGSCFTIDAITHSQAAYLYQVTEPPLTMSHITTDHTLPSQSP